MVKTELRGIDLHNSNLVIICTVYYHSAVRTIDEIENYYTLRHQKRNTRASKTKLCNSLIPNKCHHTPKARQARPMYVWHSLHVRSKDAHMFGVHPNTPPNRQMNALHTPAYVSRTPDIRFYTLHARPKLARSTLKTRYRNDLQLKYDQNYQRTYSVFTFFIR